MGHVPLKRPHGHYLSTCRSLHCTGFLTNAFCFAQGEAPLEGVVLELAKAECRSPPLRFQARLAHLPQLLQKAGHGTDYQQGP